MKIQDLEKHYKAIERKVFALNVKLDESYAVTEKILSYLNDGVVLISQEGILTYLNPAAENLLGLKLNEAVGKPFETLFSDEHFGFSMKNLLAQQEMQERALITLDREVEVSTSHIPKTGWAVQLRDRSEVARLESVMRRESRLTEIGEMAAQLAHEIRNPLGGIEGFASLLEKNVKEEKFRSMARFIIEGTHALNDLVTSVLDYSRPLALRFAPIDLVQVIENAAQLSGGCTVHRSVDTLLCSGDKQRLTGAFLNLIRNAKEASSSVEVVIKSREVAVKDQGEGIAPEHLEKIFTPFFTTKTKGTGLGLSEVQKIVKAHGGELHVDSQLGQGTTMTVELW